MKANLRRTLRVFARFFVAGGLTKAVDAWIVGLDVAWQLTVMAGMQFLVAIVLHYLIDQSEPTHRSIPRTSGCAEGPGQLLGIGESALDVPDPIVIVQVAPATLSVVTSEYRPSVSHPVDLHYAGANSSSPSTPSSVAQR
jgi:hypothetical protein